MYVVDDASKPVNSIQNGFRDKSFQFEVVFTDCITNQEIYLTCMEPLIPNIMDGFNVTCFAYGMTGAGKTHTMLGSQKNSSFISESMGPRSDQGLFFLCMNGLFKAVAKKAKETEFSVRISYLEIYNEQVRDLLTSDPQKQLMIIEDPSRGVIVPDLIEY